MTRYKVLVDDNFHCQAGDGTASIMLQSGSIEMPPKESPGRITQPGLSTLTSVGQMS